jgi:hypothetical protein
MQFTVPDTAARAFAGEFYRALAEGFPIDACVTEGRKAVMGEVGLGRPDWGIPVVYTRAADGKLFDLPTDKATSPIDSLADRREQLRTLIKDKRERLFERQRQEAVQGYSADPQIPIEIRKLKREIADLEGDLEQLEG